MVMNDFDEMAQYRMMVENLRDLVLHLEDFQTSNHVASKLVVENIQEFVVGQMDTILDSRKEIEERIQNNEGKVA